MALIFSKVYVFSPGGEWRIKYNRAIREIDFTKKKLQQEFEEKLETEQQSKRHLERKARSFEKQQIPDIYQQNNNQQNSILRNHQ